MSWADRENALRAWVVTASGLAEPLVLWGDQRIARPRPPATWIEMRLGAMSAVGIADALVVSEIALAPAGTEIEERAIGHRESGLAIQVFGATLGATSARAIAETIQQALELPTVHAALDAAGVSVFDRGSITSVPRVLETDWEGRAVLSVKFYTVAEVASRTGYIATANVGLTQQSTTFTVP